MKKILALVPVFCVLLASGFSGLDAATNTMTPAKKALIDALKEARGDNLEDDEMDITTGYGWPDGDSAITLNDLLENLGDDPLAEDEMEISFVHRRKFSLFQPKTVNKSRSFFSSLLERLKIKKAPMGSSTKPIGNNKLIIQAFNGAFGSVGVGLGVMPNITVDVLLGVGVIEYYDEWDNDINWETALGVAAKLHYDFKIGKIFTPYAGIGLGFSMVPGDFDIMAFAPGVIAGCEFAVGPRVAPYVEGGCYYNFNEIFEFKAGAGCKIRF